MTNRVVYKHEHKYYNWMFYTNNYKFFYVYNTKTHTKYEVNKIFQGCNESSFVVQLIGYEISPVDELKLINKAYALWLDDISKEC